MRHSLRQLIHHVIVESRLSDTHDRYPEHVELIDNLASSDPSENHAYLMWMAKRVIDDGEDANDVIDAMIAFHEVRNRLQKRDINAYRTLQELQDVISTVALGPRSRAVAKAGSRTVLDDGRWTIVEVMNPEAACKYGAGTQWCISASQSHNYFKQYARSNVHFYFIIDRANDARKWALALVPINAATKHGKHTKDTLFHRDDARDVHWYAELFDASDQSINPSAFFADKRQLRNAIIADITRSTKSLKTREAELNMQYDELAAAARADPHVLDDPSVPIGSIVRFAKENADIFTLSDRHVARALINASDAGLMYDLLSIEGLSIDTKSMMRLASHANPEIRAKIAKHASAPREVLDALADDTNTKVRFAVAMNVLTSPVILDRLADDDDIDIRCNVAANVSASRETLDRLANDYDDDDIQSIRFSVARNASTSREMLDQLANDDDLGVREGVAKNTSTSHETLYQLANDDNLHVRTSVAANASASHEALDQLANDDNWIVRHDVTMHASTSRETLNRLANDSDSRVRIAAKEMLKIKKNV